MNCQDCPTHIISPIQLDETIQNESSFDLEPHHLRHQISEQLSFWEIPGDKHNSIKTPVDATDFQMKMFDKTPLPSYDEWVQMTDQIEKTPTELFNATKNLVSLVYKNFNQYNIKSENSKKLFEFASLSVEDTREYQLISLTQHAWIMEWYKNQNNQIANVNYPYWRNALQKKLRFHIKRISNMVKK